MTARSIYFAKKSGALAFVNVLLVLMFGCQPDDPIVTQRVPKSQSGFDHLDSVPSNPAVSSVQQNNTVTPAESTDRMVVAIYETEGATWFFKLNGSKEQLADTESQWLAFFESIKYQESLPQWDLPAGWTKTGDRPMRFATLRIGDTEPPLELAISSLGPGQDLLLNVNRWRGQMSLAPIDHSKLAEDTKPLKSDVENALLFDVTGKSSGGMMPPFANPGALPPNPGSSSNPPTVRDPISMPATSAAGIQSVAPAGWESGQTSGITPIRLKKNEGEKSAEISVVQLPAAVNEWEPNVHRWVDQIEMPSLSDDDLKSRTSSTTIGGIDGQMLKLIPPEDSAQLSKATIAAMVKHNDTAWFFKLTGDTSVVIENESAFAEFLKSIKFADKK